MSGSVNKVIIVGNLGRDPETRYMPNGDAVTNIAVATSESWKDKNMTKSGNMRDYADVTQLVVLANLEGLNAEFIRQCLSQQDRLIKLNEIAIIQMRSLLDNPSIKRLKN